MPSAISLAASPSRSSTVTAAPARESLSAQARPIPLAAPVTRALCPVRSTLTDGPDVIETSFMSLLHLEETACPRQDLSRCATGKPVYSVVQRAFAFYTTSYVSTSANNKPLEARGTFSLRPLWNSGTPFTGLLPPG